MSREDEENDPQAIAEIGEALRESQEAEERGELLTVEEAFADLDARATARKIGRPPRPDNPVKFAVTLPLELGEWGKRQVGGLSALITRLLMEEQARG